MSKKINNNLLQLLMSRNSYTGIVGNLVFQKNGYIRIVKSKVKRKRMNNEF
jgi:hypothetical protein